MTPNDLVLGDTSRAVPDRIGSRQEFRFLFTFCATRYGMVDGRVSEGVALSKSSAAQWYFTVVIVATCK